MLTGSLTLKASKRVNKQQPANSGKLRVKQQDLPLSVAPGAAPGQRLHHLVSILVAQQPHNSADFRQRHKSWLYSKQVKEGCVIYVHPEGIGLTGSLSQEYHVKNQPNHR